MKRKPELIMVGNKLTSSSGRWNDDLIYEYVIVRGLERWITIGELAKVAWGQNNIANKRRVRSYLPKLWKHILMTKGLMLSVEYSMEGHATAQAVKIYDPNNHIERASLQKKLDRLRDRQELTEEVYNIALTLLMPRQELA